jgi:uncharacterized SAM-binding protein YcdF (DUF218 family)
MNGAETGGQKTPSKAGKNPDPASWILVTSAFHRPRAIGDFRAVGFEVEPWPVLERVPRDKEATLVFHEIAGLFAYACLAVARPFSPRRGVQFLGSA